MIETVAATPTAMNIAVAQGTYFRGMKLALAETDRRYGGSRVEDQGFVDRMLLAKSDPPQPILGPEVASHVRQSDPSKAEDRPPQSVPMAGFSEFTEELILHNARDGHWDDKTQRQARSISNLFVKFMLQDQHVQDIDALRQHHVGKFVDFLRSDIYKNYGKSAKDEGRSIAELRAIARAHHASERGIAGDTLNRHLTFLAQVFRHAVARGADALAQI